MTSVKSVPVLFLLAIGLLQNHVAGDITDARLVNGSLPLEGTVELEVNGMWYQACGVNLGPTDGVVICRHLKFAGLNRVFQTTPYTTPTTTTSSLMIQCEIGDNLANCMHSEISPCRGNGGIRCYDQTYLGCYMDKTNDRLFDEGPLEDMSMTIDQCINFCTMSTAGDFVYAGVEFGMECYCGTASENYTRHGQSGDNMCQTECGGSSIDSCGGLKHLAVFRIPMMTTAQTEQTSATTSTTTSTTAKHTEERTNQGGGGGIPDTPTAGSNIAVYAGAGGAAVIIIIIGIIIVACLVRRRSHYSEKPREKIHGAEKTSFPVFSKGEKDGNGDSYHDYDSFYHDVNFDPGQTISSGVQNYSEVDQDNYDAAMIYHNDAMEMEVIKKKNGSSVADGYIVDVSKPDPPSMSAGRGELGQGQSSYANTNSEVAHDFAALYATPDKSGKIGAERQQSQDSSVERDLSCLQNDGRVGEHDGLQGNTPTDPLPEGDESYAEVGRNVDFAAMYAQVDKSKKDSSMVGLDGDHLDEGLYAMSTDDRPTVNPDGQYGTRMVENELYKL